MAEDQLLVLTELANQIALRPLGKDPGIVEQRMGIAAVIEIGPNELEARRLEAEASGKAAEVAGKAQAEAQEKIAKLQADSQERRDQISAASQAQLAQIQKETQAELARIPAWHATFRWASTMIACALIAVGCVWAISKYPQSWQVVVPAGGVAELLLLITSVLRGRERR